MKFTVKERYDIEDLLRIMELLRSEEGCVWDREQDHHTIRNNFIEESYEAVEAIDRDDPVLLQEELGDVLLQVVFHARMEEEAGRFSFSDVCDGICKKLVYRHPHVFGDVKVQDSEEVLVNWDQLKRQEKSQETYTDTLTAVAKSLPALWRAEKVQKKAKKAGFDWSDASGAVDKLSEELSELKEAIAHNSNITEELGDLLFSVVNVSRFLKADPEEALNAATEKFISRFAKVEGMALAEGKDMAQMPMEELDKLWERAKLT